MKTAKHIEWKTLLVGTIATLIIVITLVVTASTVADILFLSKYNKSYTFSIFEKDGGFLNFSLDPNQPDAGYASAFEKFYTKWFPFISLVLSSLGILLGSYLTGKIAKTRIVLHGVIAGTIIGVLSLSWLTPLGIAAATLVQHWQIVRKHSKQLNDSILTPRVERVAKTAPLTRSFSPRFAR